MSTTVLNVDQSGDSPVPVTGHIVLTPLGKFEGTHNTSWSSWRKGSPPPELFDVKGVESCPKRSAMQCDSGSGVVSGRW